MEKIKKEENFYYNRLVLDIFSKVFWASIDY